MKTQFKVIGFDLDGTLVNSLPDLALSVNSALADFGFAPASEAQVLTWIGNGAPVLIARALKWTEGQSLPAIKPHPGPLYYLCGKFGVEPRQVLFVGDSRNDILAAHSAGCPVVGLTYGYNYNIPIAESNPDWVFDDFAKLLEIL